jgi:hypothetical protein
MGLQKAMPVISFESCDWLCIGMLCADWDSKPRTGWQTPTPAASSRYLSPSASPCRERAAPRTKLWRCTAKGTASQTSTNLRLTGRELVSQVYHGL